MKSECPICGEKLNRATCPNCGYKRIDDFVTFRTISIPTQTDMMTRKSREAKAELQRKLKAASAAAGAKPEPESRRTGNISCYDHNRFEDELDSLKTAFEGTPPKTAGNENFAVKEKPVFEGPAAQYGETGKPVKEKDYSVRLVAAEVVLTMAMILANTVPLFYYLMALAWVAVTYCLCRMVSKLSVSTILKVVIDIGGSITCLGIPAGLMGRIMGM
jgi:hypothetical protein